MTFRCENSMGSEICKQYIYGKLLFNNVFHFKDYNRQVTVILFDFKLEWISLDLIIFLKL